MPCALYLIRLIHHQSRKAFPGQRLWTASQLVVEPTVRFLRARNREGYDVYFQPYALTHNAGYILVDLDHSQPMALANMRAHGHEPCAVIETSPGHFQCWIQVSALPLPPAVATAIGRRLADLYQGDRASTDWRHLGRLAGFTNQKPHRRLSSGYAPWVKVWHAELSLASNGPGLVETASRPLARAAAVPPSPSLADRRAPLLADDLVPSLVTSAEAASIYQTCLHHLRIPQRFPHPDSNIVDLWIAQELLCRGIPPVRVKAILRLASPQFPRRHGNPEDYLERTLVQAHRRLECLAFPARMDSSPNS